MKQKQTKQHGRSMIEILAVLAIVGVLSITALVGFTYAMNKHRANETIYDVMLRGTNVPMVDENYASKPAGHQFVFRDLPAGTYYPMTTKKDAGSSYYVEATGVTYRVCEMILKMSPTDIDQIVVGNTVYTGDSDICGNADGLAMKFCFGEDGMICDGTGHGGSSGGSSGGSLGSGSGSGGSSGGTSGSSGSGSGTEPDACDGIVCQHDGRCVNGKCQCVDGYSGDYCEIEPECTTDADCSGNEVCADYSCGCPTGTTWNDVAQLCCGAPAQEDPSLCLTEYREASVGQCPGYVSACEDDQVCTDGICCRAFCPTTAGEVGYPHCASDSVTPVLGDRCLCTYTCPPPSGCTESEQECSKESDSFTGLTDFWCCDINATCGNSYGECKNACTSTQHSCSNGTDTWCCENGEMCGTSVNSCNSCTAESECDITSSTCPVCTQCGLEWILVGHNNDWYGTGIDEYPIYGCSGPKSCPAGSTWKYSSANYISSGEYAGQVVMDVYSCVDDHLIKCCKKYKEEAHIFNFEYLKPSECVVEEGDQDREYYQC